MFQLRNVPATLRAVVCALIGSACLLFLPFLILPATPETTDPLPTQQPSTTASPAPLPSGTTDGYRAVWISYLEWQRIDFSAADVFSGQLSQMFDQCVQTGINTVILQVRPFGDALYPSKLFPYSHLCTGIQGKSPGFDPLGLAIELAHNRSLRVEAWINPYRLQSGGVPSSLADNGLAAQHPEWVKEANGGLWLNPALEAVQQYIEDGVRELCQTYPLDGIHFDDYFYPTAELSWDAEEFQTYQQTGGTLTQADWRREMVSHLVQRCCAAAHEFGVTFGISPQGRLENNYNSQYSDVARWLREPGYADYLMPQLYWGLDYAKGGDRSLSLNQLLQQWLALPRDESVKFYVGLGAYRIGEGDGSEVGAEWSSGQALAQQAAVLKENNVNGIGLYRYDSLFANTAWPELAAKEVAALRSLWIPSGF